MESIWQAFVGLVKAIFAYFTSRNAAKQAEAQQVAEAAAEKTDEKTIAALSAMADTQSAAPRSNTDLLARVEDHSA